MTGTVFETRTARDHWPPNVVPSISELVALRHAIGQLPLFPTPRWTQSSGPHTSRARGRGMDFEESRPYHSGDDIRTIDWRVTARTTRTHTKVFREERERPVLLLVDLRSSMFFSSVETKSVCAARIAAALAWATLKRGDRVGALVHADVQQRDIRPRHSQQAVLRLIQSLHELAPREVSESETLPSLASLLEAGSRFGGNGATVFVISDFHDRDVACDQHLQRLARHHQVVPVFIHDRLERTLPPPGHYPISGKDGTALTLHTDNPSDRDRFTQQFAQRKQSLEQQARALRSVLISCETGDDTLTILHRYFGQRPRTPLS